MNESVRVYTCPSLWDVGKMHFVCVDILDEIKILGDYIKILLAISFKSVCHRRRYDPFVLKKRSGVEVCYARCSVFGLLANAIFKPQL
jgi:hypothetical protein